MNCKTPFTRNREWNRTKTLSKLRVTDYCQLLWLSSSSADQPSAGSSWSAVVLFLFSDYLLLSCHLQFLSINPPPPPRKKAQKAVSSTHSVYKAIPEALRTKIVLSLCLSLSLCQEKERACILQLRSYMYMYNRTTINGGGMVGPDCRGVSMYT